MKKTLVVCLCCAVFALCHASVKTINVKTVTMSVKSLSWDVSTDKNTDCRKENNLRTCYVHLSQCVFLCSSDDDVPCKQQTAMSWDCLKLFIHVSGSLMVIPVKIQEKRDFNYGEDGRITLTRQGLDLIGAEKKITPHFDKKTKDAGMHRLVARPAISLHFYNSENQTTLHKNLGVISMKTVDTYVDINAIAGNNYLLEERDNTAKNFDKGVVNLKANCASKYYGCYCDKYCSVPYSEGRIACDEYGNKKCTDTSWYPRNKESLRQCNNVLKHSGKTKKNIKLCSKKCTCSDTSNCRSCDRCGQPNCEMGYYLKKFSKGGSPGVCGPINCHSTKDAYGHPVFAGNMFCHTRYSQTFRSSPPRKLVKLPCVNLKYKNPETFGFYYCNCTGTGRRGPRCSDYIVPTIHTTQPTRTTTHTDAGGGTTRHSATTASGGTSAGLVIFLIFLVVFVILVVLALVAYWRYRKDDPRIVSVINSVRGHPTEPSNTISISQNGINQVPDMNAADTYVANSILQFENPMTEAENEASVATENEEPSTVE